MPTPTKGPRLGGSPAHQRHILANLATALFEHGKITTTEAKARRLRPVAGPRGRPRARPPRRRRPPPRTPPPPGTPRPWRTPRPWTTPPRLRPRTPPLRLRLRTRPRRQLPTLRTRRGRTPGTAPKTTASSGGEPSRPAAGPETTRVK